MSSRDHPHLRRTQVRQGQEERIEQGYPRIVLNGVVGRCNRKFSLYFRLEDCEEAVWRVGSHAAFDYCPCPTGYPSEGLAAEPFGNRLLVRRRPKIANTGQVAL